MFPDVLLKVDQCSKCLTTFSTFEQCWISIATHWTVLQVKDKVAFFNELSSAVNTCKVGSCRNKIIECTCVYCRYNKHYTYSVTWVCENRKGGQNHTLAHNRPYLSAGIEYFHLLQSQVWLYSSTVA